MKQAATGVPTVPNCLLNSQIIATVKMPKSTGVSRNAKSFSPKNSQGNEGDVIKRWAVVIGRVVFVFARMGKVKQEK